MASQLAEVRPHFTTEIVVATREISWTSSGVPLRNIRGEFQSRVVDAEVANVAQLWRGSVADGRATLETMVDEAVESSLSGPPRARSADLLRL